ncbi:MAG: hypothetical protein KJO24_05710, partial [Gammaproteobacteria bacterium]|nr:hypothetical protein [Gammaproteobacteria bacterium]
HYSRREHKAATDILHGGRIMFLGKPDFQPAIKLKSAGQINGSACASLWHPTFSYSLYSQQFNTNPYWQNSGWHFAFKRSQFIDRRLIC